MPLSYRQLSQPTIEPVTLAQAKTHLRIDDTFTDDDAYVSALIMAARQYIEAYAHRAIFNRRVLLTLDYFPWPGWGSTTGSTAHDYFMHWYYRGLTIRLPLPGTVSVESLSYINNDGETVTTIDPKNYTVDTTSEPARISPTPGYTWPYQQNYIPGQVRVQYTAGTYEPTLSESFIVPADGQYTLAQSSSLITFLGVTDANGIPAIATNASGILTFAPALAGQSLTAKYTINACPQTIVFAILLLVGHWYEHRMAATAGPLSEMPLAVESLLASEVFETFDWS